jgi:hypothetical protein
MADFERLRSGSSTWLLIGVILLITAAALLIGFVPLVPCPSCFPSPESPNYWAGNSGGVRPVPWCEECHGKFNITLLKKWTYRSVD